MKLEGMHHVTMITGDAPKNVAFYADVLGLGLVRKTVNFDAPPGFAVDEDADNLGEALRLPSQYEHLRPQLERVLTPLVNPRTEARR